MRKRSSPSPRRGSSAGSTPGPASYASLSCLAPTERHVVRRAIRRSLSADGATAALHDYFSGGFRLSVWDLEGQRCFSRSTGEGRRLRDSRSRPMEKSLPLRNTHKGLLSFGWSTLRRGKRSSWGELERNVYDPRFSADGKRLVVQHVSGREDPGRYLSCFDLPTGKQVWKLPANCDKFAVSPDGRLVMFAQYDRPGFRIIETDLKTGATTETEQPHCSRDRPSERADRVPPGRPHPDDLPSSTS